MAGYLHHGFKDNREAFHLSLNRIIDKYSKLHSIDAGLEVDFDDENFSGERLVAYMKKSKKMLKDLESQSTTDLREESLTASQDMTGHSVLLDVTHQDAEADLSVSSVSRLSANETGTTGPHVTLLTNSSMDEGQRTLSEVELQPEEQDEDLQTSLSSNGSSLWELYPDMMGRVKTAMHKQHVCEAAGDVLRRYHRLRKKPKRKYLNNTVVVSCTATRERSGEQQLKENYGSPARRQFTRTEASPRTPLGDVQSSPWKECGSPRRSQHKAILVMSLDCPFLKPEPKETSLNKTITVTRRSPSKQSASYSGSPRCSTKTTTISPLRQFKALPSPARSAQTAGRSAHDLETTAVEERSDLYSSLVTRTPSNRRIVTNISCSPQKSYRSPKQFSMYFNSEVSRRSVSLSPGLSSLSRRLTVQPPRVFSQAFQPSSEPRPRSLHPVAARHLSFDASLQSLPIPLSPQQVDEEYRKVFHKFMCQHKWGGAPASPCSLCLRARSFEVRRGHSSSVLSALALSPHASVQRKRLREWDCGSYRESKSVRRDGSMHSDRPSHDRDMLRRRLYPAECEAPGCRLPSSSMKHAAECEAPRRSLPSSPSNNREFKRFPTVWHKVRPKNMMTLHWPPPVADVSALESDDDEE